MNFGSLAASVDPKSLKARANLARVAAAYGVALEQEGDRLVGCCPFHDDTNPSFDIYIGKDGTQRWGCFACGNQGDVFTFIMLADDLKFPAAMGRLNELLDAGLPEGPCFTARPKVAVDLPAAMRSATDSVDVLVELCNDRGISVPASWLKETFGLKQSDQGEVLIPHFSPGGEVLAIKRRAAQWGWTPLALSGSSLSELYGCWRDRQHDSVILCEGESDTWTMAYMFRDEKVDVLGLPSGVSANPREEWLDRLRGRHVTILFDADTAGRRGAGTWVAALAVVADEVKVASLAEGEDATLADAKEVRQAVLEAWPFIDPGGLPVTRGGGRYIRMSQQGTPVVLSDFVLDVQRLILKEDGGVVFEVMVPGRFKPQQLTSHELANPAAMRSWSADRLLSWKGGSRDLADLIELLKAESTIVSRVKGTDVVGLHGTAFVLPTDVIGSAGWGYIAPENDVSLEESINLAEGDWSASIPAVLTGLHREEVMTPLIGWVAAAPLRSLVPKFPVLAVVGGSGWGKTTLVASVLDAFGFWTSQPMTLTATTPHGVHSYAASTNAFPVWFDEYRLGARQDAKLTLEQVLRDAWDGSSAVKGGMSDNRMRIKKLSARAPIIVTGEDGFTETSHHERMVTIQIPKTGRDSAALAHLQDAETTGFGRAYLTWLLDALKAGTLPAPPNEHDRMRQSLAVAKWGWSLFSDFTREMLGYELPPFDGKRVSAQQAEAMATPPILDAMRLALGREGRDGLPVVWTDGADICLRVQDFARWIKDSTDIILPGKTTAITLWLGEAFDTNTERSPGLGQILRLRGASEELLKV